MWVIYAIKIERKYLGIEFPGGLKIVVDPNFDVIVIGTASFTGSGLYKPKSAHREAMAYLPITLTSDSPKPTWAVDDYKFRLLHELSHHIASGLHMEELTSTEAEEQ